MAAERSSDERLHSRYDTGGVKERTATDREDSDEQTEQQ